MARKIIRVSIAEEVRERARKEQRSFLGRVCSQYAGRRSGAHDNKKRYNRARVRQETRRMLD